VTSLRAAGPGPRTVALLLALIASVAVGCGTSTAPTRSGPPAGSPSPVAAGPAVPGDSQPHWPGSTVLAVIALGAADGEIQKAGADLQAAADKQDLKAMWGAADGLAKMIDGLMPNLDRLEDFNGTTDVSKIYRQAFPELSAGARQLRDSITSGDSAGVVAGSQQIAKGLADYAPVRQLIAGLVEQAILQQRLLVK
jgi:hypothetical protein